MAGSKEGKKAKKQGGKKSQSPGGSSTDVLTIEHVSLLC